MISSARAIQARPNGDEDHHRAEGERLLDQRGEAGARVEASACAGSPRGAATILRRELGRTIAAVNPAQLLLDTAPLAPEDLAAVSALPSGRAVEARVRVALSVAGEGGQARNLTLIGLPETGSRR